MTNKLSAGSLDVTDVKILRTLQSNSNLTTKELAASVNLSPSPVYERQRRLEREGYIEKYVAVVNPRLVGNNLTVFCNICLKHHGKEIGKAFMEAISKIDEIAECYNTSGDYDFMMKIYVRSMEHYQNFVLNTLGNIESIGSLHSVFVIGEIKKSHVLPIYADAGMR